MGLQLRPAFAMDAPHEDAWTAVAQRLWPSNTPVRKAKPETVKTEVWDALEADRFSLRALTTLENLQILEKYDHNVATDRNAGELTGTRFLWPSFTSDASNQHVLLIAIFVGVKHGSRLPIWGASPRF